ncbi:hypothetical protein M501DRAFT_928050 [Patellaria atrata CBS 101060]|uniref:GTP-binding protein 8 n=1 Tax=Patellaria atrata CBS 101060 TaxID=1346257 RepID=A0A9P4SG31_9PEZI|nr:hypothetical protein M501DRAFT_928050 [Patellaria atrata CBS 101060]
MQPISSPIGYVCRKCIRRAELGRSHPVRAVSTASRATSNQFSSSNTSSQNTELYSRVHSPIHDTKLYAEKDASARTSPQTIPSNAPVALSKPADGWLTNVNTYWDTIPPTEHQLKYSNRFFTNTEPQFLFASDKFRKIPPSSTPEVAFLGRSNVGKSSLLNALLDRPVQKIAYVSKKPGKTRTMNFFGVGGSRGGIRKMMNDDEMGRRWIGKGGVTVADMPGYGSGSRGEWGEEIVKYLSRRTQLRRAFLLIDAEHGIKSTDRQMLQLMRENGVPHQIVLSKVDKILASNKGLSPQSVAMNLPTLQKLYSEIREEIQPRKSRGQKALGEIIVTSSQAALSGGQRFGVSGLRWAVLRAANLGCDEEGRKEKLDFSMQVDGYDRGSCR